MIDDGAGYYAKSIASDILHHSSKSQDTSAICAARKSFLLIPSFGRIEPPQNPTRNSSIGSWPPIFVPTQTAYRTLSPSILPSPGSGCLSSSVTNPKVINILYPKICASTPAQPCLILEWWSTQHSVPEPSISQVDSSAREHVRHSASST